MGTVAPRDRAQGRLRAPPEGGHLDRRSFRLLFVFVLILRVAICAQPLVMYDAFSYAIVGQAVSSGQNVYAATERYNYSPVWS